MDRRSSRFAGLLALCSVLGIWAFAVSAENTALLVLGPLGVAVGFVVSTRWSEGAAPRAIINTLLIGAVIFAILDTFGGGLEVEAFSQFVTLLIVLKWLDRRATRDDAQILLLTAFLAIGAMLTSNGIWVGVLLVLLLPLIGAAIVVHQVRVIAERAGGGDRPRVEPGRFGRDVRRLAASGFVVVMLISIGVFVIMPRDLGSRAFGEWGNAAAGRVSGFSDEVNLGEGGLISQSAAAVLDLEIFDRSGNRRGSTGEVFYLRGAVLDEYTNGSWRSTTEDVRRQLWNSWLPNTPNAGPIAIRPDLWTAELRITIRNAPAGRSHLFSIWRPVKIEFDQQTRWGRSPTTNMLLRNGQDGGRFSYNVLVREFESGLGEASLPRPGYSFTPFEPAIGDLAREVLVNAEIEPDPATRPFERDRAAARAIENYLQRGFFYTLDTIAAPPGRDPIEWFLTENREGHCEYFASAMAAMCRSVGVHARVVTGYVATEFNETTEHYIVRASNAHAWVEVEVAPDRWQTFDPTPPADFTRIHEPSMTIAAQIGRWFDMIEYAWVNTVVSYNANSRETVLGPASEVDQTAIEAIQGFVTKVERSPPEALRRASKNAGIAFGIAFLSLTTIAASIHFRTAIANWLVALARRFGIRGLGRPRSPSAAADWLTREISDVLTASGHRRPSWQPLLGAVREAPLADPMRRAAERGAGVVYRIRFAPHSTDPREVADAIEQIRHAKSENG